MQTLAGMRPALPRHEYVALLRERRGERSLDDVASQLGTSRQQVIQWEKIDGHGPGAHYAGRLAELFGDERLATPPRKGAGLVVSDDGLLRLLALLREAVDLLERELGPQE